MLLELFIAAEQGNLPLVHILIMQGALVDGPVEGNHYPPLCLAAKNGHIDVVKLLIANNANINKADNCGYGYAPLHQACRKGHSEIVKVLLEKGANINATNCNGDTPLHLTFKKGHTDIAKLLIKNKANFNIANNSGVLPLLLAFYYQRMEIASMLNEKGANLFLVGNNEILWLDLIRQSTELTKRVIDRTLLKNLWEKKPYVIEEHKELSQYWDTQIKKLFHCLSQEAVLGSEVLAKTIFNKVASGKNNSLLSLSFHSLFKVLNPNSTKNKTSDADQALLKMTSSC